jgi:hypothetical protein
LFGRKPSELIVPPAAKSDPRALELVRIWAAHGEQHVSMNPGVWEDPATWGIMLVDLARHVANFYSQERGMKREEVLSRIKTLFDAEWGAPTSEATGSVVR